jgi:predicted amidohydrolase
MRVAAIQLMAELGDVDQNLETCARLGHDAGSAGAEIIVLPEFFTSGVAFDEKVLGSARRADGEPLDLLKELSQRYGAMTGGSFLCADPDGDVRNAFFLVSPDGVVGRHDKDIPTMWETCFYVGGSDDGIIEHAGKTYGVALCWEFLRSATARRLRGKVDVILGGSCVWGAPDRFLPGPLRRRLDREVDGHAANWAPTQARAIGAPVVEATHCGELGGRAPWMGFTYRSYLRGGAKVCAADGTVLAHVAASQGNAVAIAEIEPLRAPPSNDVQAGSYVMDVSAPIRATQYYQTLHGTRWYRRHHRVPAPLSRSTEAK